MQYNYTIHKIIRAFPEKKKINSKRREEAVAQYWGTMGRSLTFSFVAGGIWERGRAPRWAATVETLVSVRAPLSAPRALAVLARRVPVLQDTAREPQSGRDRDMACGTPSLPASVPPCERLILRHQPEAEAAVATTSSPGRGVIKPPGGKTTH